ncbi:hypothetical protein ACP8H2_09945 [Bacillus subtilis]|uniref:hypothetical protein n=1 Tax=Bacillus subtilis TaxID=1423 RepID=UPI003CEBE6D3
MKYFSSEIKGKTISDFQKYDASLTKHEDRLKLITEMISDEDGLLHEFFVTYFKEYYSSSPSQTGWMAEQDAVCKTIEGLGTYLLNAKDIQSNRKIKYKFWKSEREFKQYKESKNVNTSTLESGLDDSVDVIDMFYSPDDKNYKLVTDQRLFAKDIKEIKEIAILQDAIESARQDSFIKAIEKRIDEILPMAEDAKDKARLTKIRSNVESYVRIWIREMKDNQIVIKESIKRPIRFKNPLKDEGAENKLDQVDFFDKNVVKVLIELVGREDITSDVGLTVHAFNQVLNNVKLYKREQDIIDLFKEGCSRKDVVEELGITRSNLNNTLNRIADKFIEQYESELQEVYNNRKKQGLKELI